MEWGYALLWKLVCAPAPVAHWLACWDMGSTNSRPKLTRVAPLQSPHNGGVSLRDGRGIWARPYRSPEPLQSGAEQQEVLGRRRTGRLPPLRQEVPLSFSVATAEPLALPPLYTGGSLLGHCALLTILTLVNCGFSTPIRNWPIRRQRSSHVAQPLLGSDCSVLDAELF